MTRSARPSTGLCAGFLIYVCLAARPGLAAPPVLAEAGPIGLVPGSTTVVTLRGRGLDAVTTVRIWGEGVVAELREPRGADLRVSIVAAHDAPPGPRSIRVLGRNGWSNALTLRLDSLPDVAEREPNDSPEAAERIGPEVSVFGHLSPRDVDWFRLAGTPGDRVGLDLEARRLGHPLMPHLAVTSRTGRPISRGVPDPSIAGDPRLWFRLPPEGDCLIEVRDALYRGGDGMSYRLRVTDAPTATGVFPLGGRAGSSISLSLIGGNLAEPVQVRLVLPERAGRIVWPGALKDDTSWYVVPQGLIAGTGPEIDEASRDASQLVLSGMVVNGRISTPGEVDRFRLDVPADRPLCLRVEAADLVSRLDGVLVVRDGSGRRMAEGDDSPSLLGPPERLGRPGPDPRIDLPSGPEGPWTVEVSDRFGRGGAEFAYRLSVGPPPRDARLVLQPGPGPDGSPWTGAFNLARGGTRLVPFRLITDGFEGTFTVRAIGLPRGVSCPTVTVRTRRNASGVLGETAGNLALTVLSEAPPPEVSAEIQFLAIATRPSGTTRLERVGESAVDLGDGGLGGVSRPVTARRSSFPVALIAPTATGPDPAATPRP